jgi:hypothetical protein
MQSIRALKEGQPLIRFKITLTRVWLWPDIFKEMLMEAINMIQFPLSSCCIFVILWRLQIGY